MVERWASKEKAGCCKGSVTTLGGNADETVRYLFVTRYLTVNNVAAFLHKVTCRINCRVHCFVVVNDGVRFLRAVPYIGCLGRTSKNAYRDDISSTQLGKCRDGILQPLRYSLSPAPAVCGDESHHTGSRLT